LNRLCHSKTPDFQRSLSLYQRSHKTWCLLSTPDSCHSFFRANSTPLANERLILSVARVNASWNMSRRAWLHEFVWLDTPATRCGHFGN
jgi:hypothetical protein